MHYSKVQFHSVTWINLCTYTLQHMRWKCLRSAGTMNGQMFPFLGNNDWPHVSVLQEQWLARCFRSSGTLIGQMSPFLRNNDWPDVSISQEQWLARCFSFHRNNDWPDVFHSIETMGGQMFSIMLEHWLARCCPLCWSIGWKCYSNPRIQASSLVWFS